MLTSSISLIGVSGVSAVFGSAYWWTGARLFAPAALGEAAVIISLMSLLGAFGTFGLGTVLIGDLAGRSTGRAAVVTTITASVGLLSGAMSLLIACGFIALAHATLPLSQQLTLIAALTMGGSLSSVALVLDQALIGLGRGSIQFQRNLVFAASKLIILAILGSLNPRATGVVIALTWTLSHLLSLVYLGIQAAWCHTNMRDWRLQKTLLRPLRGEALRHHLLNVILQSPDFVLPFVASLILSATATGYYVIVARIAALLYAVPTALTVGLFAASRASPQRSVGNLRLSLGLSFLFGILATVTLLLWASPILSMFGKVYAEGAALCLYLFGLGTIPMAIKDHYVALSRIQQRVGLATWFIACATILEIGGATFGCLVGGLAGLCLAWLLLTWIEALMMVPTIYTAAIRR